MQGNGGPNHSSGGLDGLPTELKISILKLSSDFDSLQALVHASPLFSHAYAGLRRSILSTVVIREIHPDVILDALAVLECPGVNVKRPNNEVSRGGSPSASEVFAFLARYKIDRQAESPSSLPLHTSISLISFHKKVIRYFAKDFSSSILAVHPMNNDTISDPPPLSSTEIRRIHRAFYRFELYYRLFVGSEWEMVEWLGFRAPTLHFLNLYPPWEVEELHCVHDFLYRRYLAAHLEVAQHDVHMGKSGMHSGPLRAEHLRTFNHHIEHCLALGLTYIYEAVTTPGFTPPTEVTSTNSSHSNFPGAVRSYYLPRRGSHHAEADRDADFRGDSTSNGPNEAWIWWKQYLLYPNTSDLENPPMELRKWGYCMWDSHRLRAWDVLQECYDGAYFEKKAFENFAGSRREWVAAQCTEALRAQVWLKGGSGWWTEDESRIVWSGEPREESRADTIARQRRSPDVLFGPCYKVGDI